MPRTRLIPALVLAAMMTPVPAQAFDRVRDRDTFVGLIGDRALTALGVSLRVLPDGRIAGRAFGQDVSGSWTWQDGLFCRVLETRTRKLPVNCQEVARQGDRLRFVADRGKGDSAILRLR